MRPRAALGKRRTAGQCTTCRCRSGRREPSIRLALGSGPAVILMPEMPGISPDVARFARWVRDAGFSHVAAAQGSVQPAYEASVISTRRLVIASGGSVLDVSAVRPVDVLIVPGFELSPTLDLDATLANLGPEVARFGRRRPRGQLSYRSAWAPSWSLKPGCSADAKRPHPGCSRIGSPAGTPTCAPPGELGRDRPRGDDHSGLQCHVRLRAAVHPRARRSPRRP